MNDDIYKRLKIIVFTMSILIVAAVILLTVLLIKKKKLNNPTISSISTKTNLYKTIDINEAFPNSNCHPVEVIFKDNYIVLYSKNCKAIKIFNVR